MQRRLSSVQSSTGSPNARFSRGALGTAGLRAALLPALIAAGANSSKELHALVPVQELCQALVTPFQPPPPSPPPEPRALMALPQGSAPSLSGKDWGSFGIELRFSPSWHHLEPCFPAGAREGCLPPYPPPPLAPAVLFQMDLLLMRCSVPSKLLSGSSGLPSASEQLA